MNFNSIVGALGQNIGKITHVTVKGDSTKRGASGSASSGGIFINRLGQISGSGSGGTLTVTLEGGDAQWDGALTQDGVSPYYTRAQQEMVASLLKYVRSHSDAEIEDTF
jgi:hypothetical protein